jgi:excisionase family DNA binding protein
MTTPTGPDNLVLTVPQAAKLLQLSENTVYSLVAQSQIPHVRFGKSIHIPRWGLLQYIAQSSGASLPSETEVAFLHDQSIHDEHQDQEEDNRGER